MNLKEATDIMLEALSAANEAEAQGVILGELERAAGLSQPLYIIFDGPPDKDAGRFVEVETAEGHSVSMGEWKKREDGFWQLGPYRFITKEEPKP